MKKISSLSGGFRIGGALLSIFATQTASSITSYDVRPISNSPTHLSTLNGQPACSTVYNTIGHEPDDNGSHPLMLYFEGTDFNGPDVGLDYSSAAQLAITSSMAERGYVAVSVEYDNAFDLATFNENGIRNKLSCLFDETNSESLVEKLCALSNVDCSKGIVTWGHSQGAAIALGSSQYDSRVRAANVSGYSGNMDPYSDLPLNQVRLINAENDIINNNTNHMNEFTGVDCSDSTDSCLREDGSGWVMVRASQLVTNPADHCWFFKNGCSTNTTSIEPSWWNAVPNATIQPDLDFSLVTSADWLAEAGAQSLVCPSKRFALKSKENNKFVSARLWNAGVPLKASAIAAFDWEVFSCLELGDGQIALQAANGKYVISDIMNGLKVVATGMELSEEGSFYFLNLGNDTSAFFNIASGYFVDVKNSNNRELISNSGILSQSEKFQVIKK